MTTEATETPAAEATAGIDQFELPRAVVQRLGKGAVPPEAILSKEVVAALGVSATAFISYLTAICSELAQANKQKTISAAHVLDAIDLLDWPDSTRVRKELTKELEIFRAGAGPKRSRAPKAAAAAADVAPVEPDGDAVEPATLTDDDVPAEVGPIDVDGPGTSSEDETAAT